jgi:hypothetical protein
MTHRIAPNGGGTRVNQFTLVMDVLVDTTGSFAAALLQVDSTNNFTDGDLFWQQGDFGQGAGGYNGYGTFTAGAWHRIVAAYDEAASPPVVTKFVDGIKQDDWTANQGLDDPRRALLPTVILFADGDPTGPDERRKMWVNSIQIRAGKLSDAECYSLGGPAAGGIPVVLPASTVRGQWDFDGGDLRATIGKPLQYFDPAFDGPTGTNAVKTEFGACSALGVPVIGGVDASIMKAPGDLDRRFGYVMTHGIAPNGGGSRVNQYTLVMDLLVDTSGSFAAALLQVDSTNNFTDGDLFWQQGNFGQGTGGYNGTGQFTAGAWHRIAAAYNEAATPAVVTKYVDGIFQDDWTANQGLDDPRRALLPTAILFADGDPTGPDERRIIWINSIQIRAGALTKPELAALSVPAPGGIPVNIPVEVGPRICFGVVSSQLVLNWPLNANGYTLESSPTLTPASWTPVTGVVNNSKVLPIGTGNAFFRLRK